MTTPPDMPNIGDLNLSALLRRVKIAIPLGLVVFVAGVLVIATGPLALGVVLLVLGILCPTVAVAALLVATRRTRQFTRDLQSRQQGLQGDLGRAVRDYQQRHQGEY
jgi:membrane protein implicated in regulation of membrane protease activity